MVLPLVPLIIVVVTAATGTAGVGTGVWGGAQIARAKKDMKTQAELYEARYAAHLGKTEETNLIFQTLGRSQERAQHEVIYRMKDFLERNAKQVKAHEHLILDGVDGSSRHVVGLTKLEADVAGWVRGVVGSTIVGVATPTAIRAGVIQLATASTGTAITGLSGAATTSATLAWLGGGALAAGGGGMALGAVMLNVAVIGPSALVAGMTVKNRGTKAKTEAEKHRTDVEIEIAKLDAQNELLRAVNARANELDHILIRLTDDATVSMDTLESEPFDMERYAERLQRALILVKAVRDVATAPVADEQGNLDQQTEELVLKYRNMSKETADGY
ncbi:hypothetical protein [Microbacterium sp.]|uniref:hypothetical protein n=1 Tax=Microbacterium sp. TaxID=51671 RepID=UPI0039E63134